MVNDNQHHRLLWRVFSVCCHMFPSSSIHTAIIDLVLPASPARNASKDHDNVLTILLKQAVNGWHHGSQARTAAKLLLTWCISKITGNNLHPTTKQQQPQSETLTKELKKTVSLAFAALSPTERRVIHNSTLIINILSF
jgi:hypothetical protein